MFLYPVSELFFPSFKCDRITDSTCAIAEGIVNGSFAINFYILLFNK